MHVADQPVRQKAETLLFKGGLDRGSIDAVLLPLFDDPELRDAVRQLDRVELGGVWKLTLQALPRLDTATKPSHLDVHKRLMAGLPGEALIVSAAMFLDTLADAENYFDMSFKTIKSRLGKTLDTASSERAMRAARASITATRVFGGVEAARRYMHTRNFALGGAMPVELLKTANGERIVLNELHTQAEGGPL
jgi:putative toxin-antitoxin system antitoxin component (TIGR02293 family)